MMTKSYLELATLPTFEERYHYLRLAAVVGEQTFGSERYLNQAFYTSHEWRRIRNVVQIRDEGCDLGIPGREIHGTVYIHHINPITPEDLKFGRPSLLDPDNLITVTHQTHNAIHFGDENLLVRAEPTVRTPGDTKEW